VQAVKRAGCNSPRTGLGFLPSAVPDSDRRRALLRDLAAADAGNRPAGLSPKNADLCGARGAVKALEMMDQHIHGSDLNRVDSDFSRPGRPRRHGWPADLALLTAYVCAGEELLSSKPLSSKAASLALGVNLVLSPCLAIALMAADARGGLRYQPLRLITES